MKNMDYETLMNEILSIPSIMKQIPEGLETSPLYIARHDGQKCHGILGLHPAGKNNFETVRKIMVRSLESEPDCRELPRRTICFQISDEDACMRYMQLYPAVFRFAFSETLTPVQQEELCQFCQAWESGVSLSARETLDTLFPDFYQWTNQILNKN